MCACLGAWVCACMCGSGFRLRDCAFPSNAPWGSLELVGPPVASLLIFLHPSPLGGVLAVRPRPPDGRGGSRVALRRLLVVFRRLAGHVLRPLFALLRRRTSGLEPRPALRHAGLLPLGVRGFGLQSRVGPAVRPPLTVDVWRLHPLLLALFLPNAVAKLLHAAEVRVIQQRQEIPIPHPVLGGLVDGAVRDGKPGQDFTQLLGGDDLEVEAEQRLDEAVLHGLAVVDARVGLRQAADEQALLCPENPFVELDLKNKPVRVKEQTTAAKALRPATPTSSLRSSSGFCSCQ